MTRNILKWIDKCDEENMSSDKSMPTKCIKSFGLGALEGAIDGAVIAGALLTARGLVEIVKAVIKK